MAKRKKDRGFWGLFDDAFEHLDKAMEALPSHIDNEIKAGNGSVNTIGHNNVVVQRSRGDNSPNVNIGGSTIKQSSMFGTSTSTIVQGSKKIVIKTKNNKTTITVNGKEVYKEN